MSNGLDNLDNRREQRRKGRQTPPPRHPRPETAADPEPASPHTGVPVHADTGTPADQSAEAPDRSAGTPARTRPPSIEAYLTAEQMDWLWQVRAAAMARRQENVQSSVVRLALDELAQQMSPEQIAERIADQGTPHSGGTARGRRR